MRTRTQQLAVLSAILLGLAVAPVGATWDPASGQWGKTAPTDFRVMTYNILDHVCRNATKAETDGGAGTPWHALARTVAAMRPDVLIIQEAGDNTGNGTAGGVDSVAQLTTTLGLFLHGGTDPYSPGGAVGAYVQKYAPDFDLPYIFVTTETDGYNRNVILSRYPFADLNGDGVSQYSDIRSIVADQYAPGGDGGIRGFMFAEITLPRDTYSGDLVVGNGHLKSGSASADLAERLAAAQNVAYFIDYLLNGAGTGTPDPNNKIADYPQVTSVLGPATPVVIGGDWNEDEQTNGRRGPADWLTQAATLGGTDGTDRDRTDMTYDDARHPYTNQRGTTSTTTKFDYLAWQDSIAALRRAFIFHTGTMISSYWPPEIIGYPSPATLSATASDHRTVVLDLILPAAPAPCRGDCDCDGHVGFSDIDYFVAAIPDNETAWRVLYANRHGVNPPCSFENCDANGDGSVDFADIDPFVALIPSTCP